MMRVSLAIDYGDGVCLSVAHEASGRYAPDIVNDLTSQARAALKDSVALFLASNREANAAGDTDADDEQDTA